MLTHLFSPFSLRSLRLDNRIVMPSMGVFLSDQGEATDQTMAYYRRRARGGAGLVMVEASGVAPEGVVSPQQMRLYDDAHIKGLQHVAKVIQDEGIPAGIQIHHAGRQVSPKVIGRPPYAPSNLRCTAIKGDVEPLDLPGIQRIVTLFGDAAERAVAAGFDLIEVHGAHGYLVNQFLSAYSNNREDDYGGSVANRARFAVEIVQEIRKRVGPDLPLSFKISAQEFVENGLTVEQSIEIVQILERVGIDVVQVSAGCDATPEWISQPMLMERGCLVDSAWAIRKAVDIPVMCVGRINGPFLAEEILSDEKADLVCMGRALLADPDLPVKARQERFDDIRRCVACNTCINSIFKKGQVECLVNPELTREQELTIIPARGRRKVVVVGGGPGGAEAAWTAAFRGHDTVLLESGPELGGQIRLGALPDYKKELLNIIRFHKHQLETHGVVCRFNQQATAESVLDLKPDAVILATGGRPIRPGFLEGQNNVLEYEQVLEGKVALPEELAVIGGGPTGCEVALELAEKGYRVSILEMLERIGKQYEAMTRKLILNRMKALGVKVFTNSCITSYDGRRLIYNNENHQGSLDVPLVILALGAKPVDSLETPLRDAGLEVLNIGDSKQPRSIKEAIYEGALAGREV